MIPKTIPEKLESQRLLIRPPTLADVPQIYEAVRESLPELKPWLPWATERYSLAGCEENIRGAMAKFITRKDLRYHFHSLETGELIACSGLHAIDWDVPKVEIGYWCRSSKTGKGYVSEGVKRLTEVALRDLGVARVEIQCDTENTRSIAVAETCGYTLEGILQNDGRAPDGRLRATRIYARTNTP